METYLVGGAVRDKLMGLTPKDLDYVVVGQTPEKMLEQGFSQVGADFPVFLHPETGDEYALARAEKKVGVGYTDFTCVWDCVPIWEDLDRRDLTINSIAMHSNGDLMDPCNGQQDIEDKILRHTSEAFSEDPVRVLRIARFLARFGDEWTVAPETYALCQRVAWAEFKHLTPERVFKEMDKALSEPHPWLFFEFLHMLDFHWFKELWDLKGIPQPITHHPENCTFQHTMLSLKQGVKMSFSNEQLFAVLCHDLGKAPCWKERGNLHGHESAGIPFVEALCDRLKVPSSYRELAVKVCENHQRGHKVMDMKPASIHNLFKKLDCIRKPDILGKFTECNWADATGRLGFEDKDYPQRGFLFSCLFAVQGVDTKTIAEECIEKGLTGADIGERIRVKQIDAIRGVKNTWNKN
jgi:tRNA nucleotidyltransferase (CCA-adding enzyme)